GEDESDRKERTPIHCEHLVEAIRAESRANRTAILSSGKRARQSDRGTNPGHASAFGPLRPRRDQPTRFLVASGALSKLTGCLGGGAPERVGERGGRRESERMGDDLDGGLSA